MSNPREPGDSNIRRRSNSEGDHDHLNSTSLQTGSNIIQSVGNIPSERFQSNPNLSIHDGDQDYFESPLGTGLATRLQVKLDTRAVERQKFAKQSCLQLIRDVKSWQTIFLAPNSEIPIQEIHRDFDIFSKRIRDVSSNAMLRRVDVNTINEVQELQFVIKRIKRKADSLDKGPSLQSDSHRSSSDSSIENDDAFYNDNDKSKNLDNQPPNLSPIISGSNVRSEPNVASDLISNLGPKSPLIKSVENIRSMINNAQRTNSNLNPSVSSHNPGNIQDYGDSIITKFQSLVDINIERQNNRLDTIDSLGKHLQHQITGLVESIKVANDRIESVEAQTIKNRRDITELTTTISEVDSKLQDYIDKKTAGLAQRLDESIICTESGDLSDIVKKGIQENIERTSPGAVITEVRKEIELIKKGHVKVNRRSKISEQLISNLTELVADIKDQVDKTQEINLTTAQTLAQQNQDCSNTNPMRSSNEANIIKAGIDRIVRLISQLISTKITDTADLALIKKCNKEDVTKITKYSRICRDDLLKYVAYPGADNTFCTGVNDLLEKADNWILDMEQLYVRSEAHVSTTGKGNLDHLGVFTNNAAKTIYEFFDDAEMALMGWGNSRQRAYQLFNHLSEPIKAKLEDISDNYAQIKARLIEEYGTADRIISDVVKALVNGKKPTLGDKRERSCFFSNFASGIQRLDKLSKVPEIPIAVLQALLYSRNTLSSMIGILPSEDSDQLRRKFADRKLDWDNPCGIHTFALLKEYVETERSIAEPFKGLSNSNQGGNNSSSSSSTHLKSKPKSAFTASNVQYSSDEETTVHVTNTFQAKPWFSPGLKFPCPLEGHNHEMADCVVFLTMKPAERWEKTKVNRICYCCLKPKSICVTRRCNFADTVPDALVCQGCIEYAQEKGFAPFNILLCRKERHHELRANFSDIHRIMEKYLGKIHSSITKQNLRVSANFMFQVHSIAPCHPKTECSCCVTPSTLGINTPSIDTRTGELMFPKSSNVIPESKEHSIYLMQILKVGNTDVLTFFDSGANVNLIDGKVATNENLQLISPKPTALTVVGGGTVKTSYGSYRFNMGPTEGNQYHEITTVGMDSVTMEFRKYYLEEICEEYRKSCNEGDNIEQLPPYIGGSPVHLLIGIKNTRLSPVLIKVLDSGIGVYRSPFTDIFGSNIIFGGPHRVFTKGNGDNTDILSHAIFHTRMLANQEVQEEFRQYSFQVDSKENIKIYPHPINYEDMVDADLMEDRIDEDDKDFDSSEGSDIDESNILKVPHFCTSHGKIELIPKKCSVHKATIPIARIREMINQDDIDNTSSGVDYRCSKCSSCQECKKSPRNTAISLQESMEQSIIEQSVTVNRSTGKVIVKLPFKKNPDDFLIKKHHGNDNFAQAKKVYITQCRKPELMLEGMRRAHAELVASKFMIRLIDLDQKIQDAINQAPFRHAHPWRLMFKESISTPIRMVVDPTMTGLNQMLAKGENTLGMIFDLIIRSRGRPFIWSSDISKLYNQLFLDESAFPYSLFLYHESLDPKKEPEVWVMLRAWYGIVPTGAQAGFALDELARMGSTEFPNAVDCIVRDRYVDDILPGAQTADEVSNQIKEVSELLKSGGFSLKYIVQSGFAPEEKASSDGESIKLLGYKWMTESDVLLPGFSELNMNKKVRGARKPNETPIITVNDAIKLLEPIKLTRRLIISKISELFDPCGLWEPIKLQLKLASSRLSGLSWDQVVPEAEQSYWKTKLTEFIDYNKLTAHRSPIPADIQSSSDVRLICLSDAGTNAGGAIVYAGRKYKDGTWSCSMIAAKSKLMKFTIPRNELSAILMMVELGYLVKKALQNEVSEVI